MKLFESHNEIRITNDKGTKLITAIRNENTDQYVVSLITRGSFKTLAYCADKQVINHYAIKYLSK